jgi:hypothetical protein
VTTASIVASRGWIIPAPFAIAAYDEAVAAHDRLLRAAISRENRCRGGLAAVRPKRRGGLAQSADDLLEWQLHADYSGREDDDLLSLQAEKLRRLAGRALSVRDPLRACRRVCDSGVHDDGLWLRNLEVS